MFQTVHSGLVTTPTVCADKQDCSGYDDDACVDFPSWAKETCPDKCGYCSGVLGKYAND